MLLALATLMLAQSFFGGLPIDGIHCDRQEGAAEHIHALLSLYDRGRRITIPANVGIPVGAQCLYWLHTHSDDGIIHIESPVRRTFTLGEFFDIWGPELSGTRAGSMSASRGQRLAIWVNGVPWQGHDPRSIVLRDHESIVIQNGPPFTHPPKPDWSKLG
ncbi:MAG: hypothetical protein JO263_07585 [Candidatus Eremiobacteraeota bacterium]|nr:hypothetical protein [Candidatus Eremiobacteraeota bacterium]